MLISGMCTFKNLSCILRIRILYKILKFVHTDKCYMDKQESILDIEIQNIVQEIKIRPYRKIV